jgi:hypothetical protein
MSKEETAPSGYTLEVARLFERVNAERKMRSLPPVENSAMASRCTLRFNIDKPRGLDFNQKTVVLAPEDVEALEQLVNDQFDCRLEGVVERLCAKPKVVPKPAPVVPQMAPELQPSDQDESGLMSKIKKIFGGD